MCLPFSLPLINVDELEAAESSSDFCLKFNINSSTPGQIIEFKAENRRCKDFVFGYVQLSDGLIKDLYIERTGCSLSKASIVVFGQHILNHPASIIAKVENKVWLAGVGSSHPMRNECVLFGINAIQKALSTKS